MHFVDNSDSPATEALDCSTTSAESIAPEGDLGADQLMPDCGTLSGLELVDPISGAPQFELSDHASVAPPDPNLFSPVDVHQDGAEYGTPWPVLPSHRRSLHNFEVDPSLYMPPEMLKELEQLGSPNSQYTEYTDASSMLMGMPPNPFYPSFRRCSHFSISPEFCPPGLLNEDLMCAPWEVLAAGEMEKSPSPPLVRKASVIATPGVLARIAEGVAPDKFAELVRGDTQAGEGPTTVCVTYLPSTHHAFGLLAILEDLGFDKTNVGFVHVPFNKVRQFYSGTGYVDFNTPELAFDFLKAFADHKERPEKLKQLKVSYSVLQGLDELIQYFGNGSLDPHEIPLLFVEGEAFPFYGQEFVEYNSVENGGLLYFHGRRMTTVQIPRNVVLLENTQPLVDLLIDLGFTTKDFDFVYYVPLKAPTFAGHAVVNFVSYELRSKFRCAIKWFTEKSVFPSALQGLVALVSYFWNAKDSIEGHVENPFVYQQGELVTDLEAHLRMLEKLKDASPVSHPKLTPKSEHRRRKTYSNY